MKILLVDDSDIQIRIARAVLIQAGHQVVQAANGQIAWELLQSEHFRFVITDWIMPVMDGLELIRRIRAANWAHYTYIILLTSQDSKDRLIEGLNAGSDDFLSKPFDTGELMARLGIGKRILDLETRLADMARQDLLTGLFNRRALYETLQTLSSQAQREQSCLSVILIDLDHFKRVNDQFGHPAGDQALRLVAALLQKHQRAYDHVGRWGGEEFLAVLPNTEPRHAYQVAERLRASIAASPLALDAQTPIELTASMGVAGNNYRVAPLAIDVLLKQADDALYQSKNSGRNQVYLYQ